MPPDRELHWMHAGVLSAKRATRFLSYRIRQFNQSLSARAAGRSPLSRGNHDFAIPNLINAGALFTVEAMQKSSGKHCWISPDKSIMMPLKHRERKQKIESTAP
jgi:hypothetical protein